PTVKYAVGSPCACSSELIPQLCQPSAPIRELRRTGEGRQRPEQVSRLWRRETHAVGRGAYGPGVTRAHRDDARAGGGPGADRRVAPGQARADDSDGSAGWL